MSVYKTKNTSHIETWWNIGAIPSLAHMDTLQPLNRLITNVLEYFENTPKTAHEITQFAFQHPSMMSDVLRSIYATKRDELERNIQNALQSNTKSFARVGDGYKIDFTPFVIKHPDGITEDDFFIFEALFETLRYSKRYVSVEEMAPILVENPTNILALVTMYNDVNPYLFRITKDLKIMLNDTPEDESDDDNENDVVDVDNHENDVVDVDGIVDNHENDVDVVDVDGNDDAQTYDVVNVDAESDSDEPVEEDSINREIVFNEYRNAMNAFNSSIRRNMNEQGKEILSSSSREIQELARMLPTLKLDAPLELKVNITAKSLLLVGNITQRDSDLHDYLPLCLGATFGHVTLRKVGFFNGWIYRLYRRNVQSIREFAILVSDINKKYIGKRITLDVAPLNKQYGIINWDIRFDPSPWLVQCLTEMNLEKTLVPRRNNPIYELGHDGIATIKFKRGGTLTTVMNQIIALMQSMQSTRGFAMRIYRYHVKSEHEMDGFLTDSSATLAVLSWSQHARFACKVGQTLIVMDPWKQSVHFPWTNVCAARGFRYEFKKRIRDQAYGEGSCMSAALMRTIMIARDSLNGATAPVDFNVAILTQRLISKFRSAPGQKRKR
jgi:hypothetical protein